MNDNIEILDQQSHTMSDAELDDWVSSLPEPSDESLANYQRKLDYMMKINQEAGVFQDIECHTAQDPIDNNKYIESIYTWQHSPDVN